MEDIEKKNAPEYVRVVPAVDIMEGDGEYVIVADMPGVAAGDLTIHLDHEDLLVEGRQALAGDAGVAPLMFARSFHVPGEVRPDGIDASMKDGVLSITLRKGEDARPRRIEVKAG